MDVVDLVLVFWFLNLKGFGDCFKIVVGVNGLVIGLVVVVIVKGLDLNRFIIGVLVEIGVGVKGFDIGIFVEIGVGVKGFVMGVDVVIGFGFVLKFIKLIIFLELVCLIIGVEVVDFLLVKWLRFCDCVWFVNLIYKKKVGGVRYVYDLFLGNIGE